MEFNPRKKSRQTLHPRNLHQGLYDFEQLVESYPALAPFVAKNDHGQFSIDFADPKAVLSLNTALLKHHYQVQDWAIPEGYLCPPIPGRADYVHYVGDLLAASNQGRIPTGPAVRVLDIGTGANIIYPIVGIRSYQWHFVGTEVDPRALASAKKIQEANEWLQVSLTLKKQTEPNAFFKNIIAEDEFVDLSICNPPFYESEDEARRSTLRKQRNLQQEPDPKRRNFGGQQHELWYPGGERAFISQMIAESQTFGNQCFWFTTLVSRENHLPKLYHELEKVHPEMIKTIEMGQGNKRSRMLAWTFLTSKQQKAWTNYRWSKTNR